MMAEGLGFTTSMGMVARALDYSTNVGLSAQSAVLTCFSDRFVLMLCIAYFANRGPAGVVHHPHFATGQSEGDVASLFGHNLSTLLKVDFSPRRYQVPAADGSGMIPLPVDIRFIHELGHADLLIHGEETYVGTGPTHKAANDRENSFRELLGLPKRHPIDSLPTNVDH